ncbi:metallophosphoesterase [Candidatus Sumerlaeota bacterium]|nr:metallophosphoesterase [Candidatus Sumerlaeota bacterium]
MIIGVISDTHDHLQRINDAIDLFNREKVGAVVHCGDFVAPFAIKLFMKLDCPFYSVFGNNDGERDGLVKAVRSFHGEIYDPPHIYEIDGKRIYVAHSPVDSGSISNLPIPPHYILYGHTHKMESANIGRVPAFNPGEACGWLTGKALAGLLDSQSGEFQSAPLK